MPSGSQGSSTWLSFWYCSTVPGGDDVMELWVEPIEERPCGLVIGISAVVL
jgi:hypothetical protein